ncbi:MAG: helix-turn-helix domain-containing protein [Clostridium sp.]|nr:helix-turn-helix domain-containing protein [Clostridium sp.]MCM1534675.1 helix-turn-helix domain-containing protein [Clostridium sp.]
MKTFDTKKFCEDLMKLRGQETQKSFAEKLQINRSTLSLLETGKQLPSLDILNKVCNLGHFQPNDYFRECNNDALIYLMGTLEESDKEKIVSMMHRIQTKEKYELLARRCMDGID